MISAAPLPSAAEFVPGVALATAIGLLIGAERGWRMREEEPGSRVAGVRTFAILGLLGGLLGVAAALGHEPLAVAIALGALAMLLIGYLTAMRTEANLSATSAVAAVVTMLLGTLAASGQMALASVGAGIMVVLLASRETLHGALGRTSQAEMTALIRMALVVFLILPLLPDAEVGPFGGINPRRIWFVVVVVGAVSLAGYVLVRWQGGRRGTLLMALIGSLVSSTAVTIEAARRIRERGGSAVEDGAVSVATLVMLPRVALLTAVVAPAVAGEVLRLLAPAAAVALVFAAAHVWLAFDRRGGEDEPALKPPSLVLALLFAALVAAVSFGARWAEHRYGGGSGALVIAVGGMVDVDSAIAAVGALSAGALSPRLAALAIAAPVVFNTLLKLGLLIAIAGVRSGLRAGASLALSAVALLAAAAAAW